MSETALTVSFDDLIKALDLLHEVFWDIKSVSGTIANGSFVSYSVIEQLRDSWNKMSKSRECTQRLHSVDENVQLAMGCVNDAKSMIESLIAWNSELTPHAQFSIRLALLNGLEEVKRSLTKLESIAFGI